MASGNEVPTSCFAINRDDVSAAFGGYVLSRQRYKYTVPGGEHETLGHR